MATRRIQCREHPGGIFTIEVKRGRQPVRCKLESPCDKAVATYVDGPAENDFDAMSNADLKAYARANYSTISKLTSRAQLISAMRAQDAKQLPPAVVAPTAATSANPSAALARATKERLVALGWVCKGNAGRNELDGSWAEMTCSRGSETLALSWADGKLFGQEYLMESERPEENGIPRHQLHFEPDETTDSELVRLIRGMKITWWNTIAGANETAVVGGNVTVEHMFRTNGDEDEPKRIVKFLDHNGGGFRAFHVAALLKVG